MSQWKFSIVLFFEDSHHVKVTGTSIKEVTAEATAVLRAKRGIALVEFTTDIEKLNPQGER